MLQQQGRPMKKQEKCNVLGPVAPVFASANTGSWRLERPVVDFDKCVQCGTCVRFCPVGIVTLDKTRKECISFDWNYCKGCGICANECPRQCITMEPEGSEK